MKALALSAVVLAAAAILAPAAHAETALQLKSRCTGMTGVANASECRGQVGGMVNTLKDNPAYCASKSGLLGMRPRSKACPKKRRMDSRPFSP